MSKIVSGETVSKETFYHTIQIRQGLKGDLLQAIHYYTDHHLFFLGIGFCHHISSLKSWQNYGQTKMII